MQTYFIACAVMGLGIGFDVVLATLSRLKHINGKRWLIWTRQITRAQQRNRGQQKKTGQGGLIWARRIASIHILCLMTLTLARRITRTQRRNRSLHKKTGRGGLIWVRRITATHILFPMTGYYVFIGLFQSFPRLRDLLGIIAFALVSYFLFDLVKDWIVGEDEENEGDPFSWTVVLSVSWDALFSGPAKSAQAIGWSKFEVLFSFFISGLVVTALAFTALVVAYGIREAATSLLKTSMTGMTLLHLLMMYIEFTVLAYFGVLSLFRYTFSSELSMLEVAVIAILVGVVVFLSAGRTLFSKTRSRVVIMLGGAKTTQPV